MNYDAYVLIASIHPRADARPIELATVAAIKESIGHSESGEPLGFVADIHHETLDGGKHRTSSTTKRERAAPLPKECPACSFLKPAGIRECSACGFVPERQSTIEEKAGSLVPINGKRKNKGEATPHTKQEVYSMLIAYTRERGHKPGFAAAKYKDRYGVWPRGLAEVPLEPDGAFRSWMLSQQIAWRHSKKRREAANGTGAHHASP